MGETFLGMTYREATSYPGPMVNIMSILEARQLYKTYTVDNRRISVLKDISLSIATGEFVVIAGSSGIQ